MGLGLQGEQPSSGNPSSISGTLTNTTNAPVTATYTVTPTTGTCTGPAFTVTVTVNPGPVITNITATICSGGTFTVTPENVTNGIVPAGTTYTWANPVITPNGAITGTGSGTAQTSISQTPTNITNAAATVTYTVTPAAGTCSGPTFTVIVTVNPVPAITAMTATSCSGTSFSVTPVQFTNGLVPAGTTYSWPAPGGSGVYRRSSKQRQSLQHQRYFD